MKELTLDGFKEFCLEKGIFNSSSEYIPDNPFKSSYWRYTNKQELTKEEKAGYYIIITAETGRTGGNCWGGEPDEPFSRNIQVNDNFLETILEEFKPDILYLEFRALEKQITKHEFEKTQNEYYGNSTTYSGYYYNLTEVFKVLVENKIISAPEKTAILIGGLPCSGKTTLAKSEYKDYYLIDDPRDFNKDVQKHLKKNKLVITDPHLSFKENRQKAIDLLNRAGFCVVVKLLNVHKKTLLKRAKVLGKEDRIDFIKQFKLEK